LLIVSLEWWCGGVVSPGGRPRDPARLAIRTSSDKARARPKSSLIFSVNEIENLIPAGGFCSRAANLAFLSSIGKHEHPSIYAEQIEGVVDGRWPLLAH